MDLLQLKNIIRDLPDNMRIQMIERGGFVVNVDDVFVEEDDDGRKTLFISH